MSWMNKKANAMTAKTHHKIEYLRSLLIKSIVNNKIKSKLLNIKSSMNNHMIKSKIKIQPYKIQMQIPSSKK